MDNNKLYQSHVIPKTVAMALAFAMSTTGYAEGISGTDILNLLVEEGVLTEQAAEKLITKVRQRAEKAKTIEEQVVESSDGNTLKVPYVPNYVKDEIKEDVAGELRGQVLEDVIAHAKTERWGVPNAQPSWTEKISFSGDARLRYQADLFDDDNPELQIYDLNEVNKAGGRPAAGRDGFVNVNDDRHRLRGRFRFMMKAKPTQGVEVGMRMVTGSEGNPVSSNQTLGQYGDKWDINLDLAYLKYRTLDKSIMVQGGRFKNPFFHTDLMWDDDMTFEGVSGSWHFLRNDDMEDDFRQLDPFVTVGAFPLDEINSVSLPGDLGGAPDDKWLYAAQIGTHYDFWDQSRLSVGLSYYHFDNITAEGNAFNSDLQDPTAPISLQFGNWVYDIRNTDDAGDELFGLASEYEVAGLTIKYDYAGFSPYHVILTGDVIKNLAFDQDDIAERSGDDPSEIFDRDFGYQFGVVVGWPNMDLRGNWKLSFVYRNIEGDATVDAFADSDFLLGGTNAKGYIIRGDYALLDSLYTSFRYISAEEVDADVLNSVAVDRLFIDLGAKF